MSRLTIHADDRPETPWSSTTDAAAIAAGLAEIGIVFERWRADVVLPAEADDTAVLAAYAADVARLTLAGGYRTVDVIRVASDNPAAAEMRAKFLNEHTHGEDEIRFFVEGSAQFYLHLAGKVFITTCEAGDLISVPAGTPHWFDMGPHPCFTAIRLFVSPDGWVARFTGSAIATEFPKFGAMAGSIA